MPGVVVFYLAIPVRGPQIGSAPLELCPRGEIKIEGCDLMATLFDDFEKGSFYRGAIEMAVSSRGRRPWCRKQIRNGSDYKKSEFGIRSVIFGIGGVDFHLP